MAITAISPTRSRKNGKPHHAGSDGIAPTRTDCAVGSPGLVRVMDDHDGEGLRGVPRRMRKNREEEGRHGAERILGIRLQEDSILADLLLLYFTLRHHRRDGAVSGEAGRRGLARIYLRRFRDGVDRKPGVPDPLQPPSRQTPFGTGEG